MFEAGAGFSAVELANQRGDWIAPRAFVARWASDLGATGEQTEAW